MMIYIYLLLLFIVLLTSWYLQKDEKDEKDEKNILKTLDKDNFNITDKIDQSYKKFQDEIAPYRINGSSGSYTYPEPDKQPITFPKFNDVYKSPTLKQSNWM